MGIYSRHVFPRVMDWAMRQMAELRPGTLARAHGEVLEIGFGTGLNLPHYPSSVRKLVALDPLAALPARVAGRIARAPFPVERFTLPAEGGLPFHDGCFDCVEALRDTRIADCMEVNLEAFGIECGHRFL